jgi:hypothetical protein
MPVITANYQKRSSPHKKFYVVRHIKAHISGRPTSGETQLIQGGAHVNLSPSSTRRDTQPSLAPIEGDKPQI